MRDSNKDDELEKNDLENRLNWFEFEGIEHLDQQMNAITNNNTNNTNNNETQINEIIFKDLEEHNVEEDDEDLDEEEEDIYQDEMEDQEKSYEEMPGDSTEDNYDFDEQEEELYEEEEEDVEDDYEEEEFSSDFDEELKEEFKEDLVRWKKHAIKHIPLFTHKWQKKMHNSFRVEEEDLKKVDIKQEEKRLYKLKGLIFNICHEMNKFSRSYREKIRIIEEMYQLEPKRVRPFHTTENNPILDTLKNLSKMSKLADKQIKKELETNLIPQIFIEKPSAVPEQPEEVIPPPSQPILQDNSSTSNNPSHLFSFFYPSTQEINNTTTSNNNTTTNNNNTTLFNENFNLNSQFGDMHQFFEDYSDSTYFSSQPTYPSLSSQSSSQSSSSANTDIQNTIKKWLNTVNKALSSKLENKKESIEIDLPRFLWNGSIAVWLIDRCTERINENEFWITDIDHLFKLCNDAQCDPHLLVGSILSHDFESNHDYMLTNEMNTPKCVIYLTKNFPFKITFHHNNPNSSSSSSASFVRLSFQKVIYSKHEFLSISYNALGKEVEEEQEKLWNEYEKMFTWEKF